MTASWLRQMGWQDVFVLTAPAPRPFHRPRILGDPPQAELRIECDALAELMAADQATIVDFSLSREYLKAHIPGAWFAIRARLASALARIPLHGTLVLTSEDGDPRRVSGARGEGARRYAGALSRRRKRGMAGFRASAYRG